MRTDTAIYDLAMPKDRLVRF